MQQTEFEHEYLQLPEGLWQAFAQRLHLLVDRDYGRKLDLAIAFEGDIDRLICTLEGLEETEYRSKREGDRRIWTIEPDRADGERVRRAIVLSKRSLSFIRVVIPGENDKPATMSVAIHKFGKVNTRFGNQEVAQAVASKRPLREIPFANYLLKDDLANMEQAQGLVLEVVSVGD